VRPDGSVVRVPARDNYICSSYSYPGATLPDPCSMHFINSKNVNILILETIRRTVGYARGNEAEFMETLREASAVRQADEAKAHRRLIAKNERRISELDLLFRKTYEDYAAGRLAEKRFELLSGGYETEQAELEAQTASIKSELAQFDSDSFRADRFIELAKRYTDYSELTPAMLHEFIEKVIVHEADKSSGWRVQRVDIFLNYIGQFHVPEEYEGEEIECPALTPEEQKRAKWREYKHRARAKKLAAAAQREQEQLAA